MRGSAFVRGCTVPSTATFTTQRCQCASPVRCEPLESTPKQIVALPLTADCLGVTSRYCRGSHSTGWKHWQRWVVNVGVEGTVQSRRALFRAWTNESEAIYKVHMHSFYWFRFTSSRSRNAPDFWARLYIASLNSFRNIAPLNLIGPTTKWTKIWTV